ncbi:unnamed protein product [Orchesella dallaii]|uniref:DUF4806 domain-containing protein n=1 Tax=Orchesella dallaii TaxID=48710 RepID=A0ABP1RHD2_9HEXA
MFYIVEFTDEKAREIVPESWFVDGKCAWPNTNDSAKIRTAVQKSKPPKRSWKLHSFRVLHRYGLFINIIVSLSFETVWPHMLKVWLKITETYELAVGQLDYAMQESDLSEYETARKKRKPDREEPNDEYAQQNEVVDPEPVARMPNLQIVEPPDVVVHDQLCTDRQDPPVILNRIDPTPVVTGIADIKLTLQQILDMLLNLSERVERLENPPGTACAPVTEGALEGTLFQFPISSQQQLATFNDELGMNPALKQNLVKHFFYKGGTTILESVKFMLGTVMTDELASQYSLVGARGKKAFADNNHLFYTMQGALIMNPLTKAVATEANLRTGLQSYFKIVADREDPVVA